MDRVPAPAHDSLSPAERRRFLETNPDCYLTVTRSPEDLAPGQVWDAEEALEASRTALDRLLAAGAFTSPETPALYLYRLTADGHCQVGFVGGVSVDDYDRGTVRIHEQIKAVRASHLATQLDELGVQSSPITLAHKPNESIAETAAAIVATDQPVIAVTSADGLRQEVWEVTDSSTIATVTDALADEFLYLIDGHHRAAAASAHRARVEPGTGEGGADLMLCAVFPSTQLKNEAFHRCVNGVDPTELIATLEAATTVRSVDTIDEVLDRRSDELALWTGDRWQLVTPPSARESSPLEALDPVRLERHVLWPLLGIDESNPSGQLSYRHGMADRADLEQLQTLSSGAVWAMRPVPMETLMAVSDEGLTMPPKSTYFVPKVRSGVFLRSVR
ncbi:MAG: DUF1015 family protein [Acidimicrobiales bacterium]